MKKLVITSVISMFILTTANSFAINGTNISVNGTKASPDTVSIEEPFYVQEEIAEFPGGEMALDKFIQKSINYPAIAKAQGIEGKVIIALVIDETGTIKNIEVIQGIGGGCEEEVVRVLSEMPNWMPTKQAGHNVQMKKVFSFSFHL